MKATTKGHDLMNFQALQIALELIRALRPVIDKVGRSSKREAEQMQDAANSVARNLAEGRRRRGKDRRYLWDVAAGSADEVRTSMLICLANGWLDEADVKGAMALDDRVLAIAWRLTH
ncbi:MAG: four helix bundle protein [Micrococcales bacterium]|nr:four helix bundle protein [Micrococcales bacterium]